MRARRGARTYARAGTALAVLLALSACGGGQGGTAPTAPPSSTRSGSADPAAGRYDPPLRFAKHGVRLPPLEGRAAADPPPIALHGTDAYVAGPDGMQVVDTRTGKLLATVERQGPAPDPATGTGPVSAPLVTAVGDSTLSLALVPFLVTAAAHGDTPAGTGVELDAVDTSTLQTVWTATIGGLPAWASDGSAAELGATVIGVQGDVAVVRISGAGVIGTTVGVDLMKHQALWHQDGFAADAVSGGMAVGRIAAHAGDPAAGTAVAAVDTTDGEQAWKELDASVVSVGPAAPGRVVVDGAGDGGRFAYLVDTADGKRTDLPTAGADLGTCRYDGAATLVCAGHGSTAQSAGSRTGAGEDSGADRVVGLDAADGRLLWQLPSGPTGGAQDGAAPIVTAVWHGAVYGSTGAGPVVLDARTGTDRGTAPGIAPALLDGDVGLTGGATASGGRVSAYPATG